MKPITENTIQQLIAAARYGNCALVLDVAETGIVIKLTKQTNVTATTSTSRTTEIAFHVHANDPNAEEKITKAFYALP